MDVNEHSPERRQVVMEITRHEIGPDLSVLWHTVELMVNWGLTLPPRWASEGLRNCECRMELQSRESESWVVSREI